MKIDYSSARLNGRKYVHLPETDRPVRYSVQVTDDADNVYMFRSNGDAVTARDWYNAQIDGRRYTTSNAWSHDPVGLIHDRPVPEEPISIYFAYGGEPNIDDVSRIVEVIKMLTVIPVHFNLNDVFTVTI